MGIFFWRKNIADTAKNNEIFKKYNQMFNWIKYHITYIDESDGEYDEDYMKIKFNTDDDIPLRNCCVF